MAALRLAARQYSKTALMAAASLTGEGPLFLIDYAMRFLRVVVLLSIWRLLLAHRGPVSGMTLGAVLTYTLVSEVFAEQLNCSTELPNAFWEGSVVTRFLQPMSVYGQFIALTAGRWIVHFAAFSLPLLLISPLLGVDPRPASVGRGLLFLLSLALAVIVGLAIEFTSFAVLIAQLAMSPWIVSYLRQAIGTLLSGSLLPLALLPWNLGRVFGWLPFAAMASAPLRIYTGSGSPGPLLLMQAAWGLLLWPLAWWSWNRGREKLAFHGG